MSAPTTIGRQQQGAYVNAYYSDPLSRSANTLESLRGALSESNTCALFHDVDSRAGAN